VAQRSERMLYELRYAQMLLVPSVLDRAAANSKGGVHDLDLNLNQSIKIHFKLIININFKLNECSKNVPKIHNALN
jgi:hypothetical protein